MNSNIKPGYCFDETRKFTVKELSDMACQCGDMNYVHHDLELAKNTRFKNIIASGSAIAGLFTAMIPTHFSDLSPMLGLEMSLKFPAPIYPDTELVMKWVVTNTVEKSGNNTLVSLEGTITDENGVVSVLAQTSILLVERL